MGTRKLKRVEENLWITLQKRRFKRIIGTNPERETTHKKVTNSTDGQNIFKSKRGALKEARTRRKSILENKLRIILELKRIKKEYQEQSAYADWIYRKVTNTPSSGTSSGPYGPSWVNIWQNALSRQRQLRQIFQQTCKEVTDDSNLPSTLTLLDFDNAKNIRPFTNIHKTIQIGGEFGIPVVIPPAISRIMQKPKFEENGELTKASVIKVTWSADHRIIDGATMCRFNNQWKTKRVDPLSIIRDMQKQIFKS